jgi:hypothetical protein
MGRQAEAIAARLKKLIEQVFKALTLEIDRELRISTPVDTGFARANWVPSVGAPHVGDVSGPAEHAAGASQVLRFKLEDGSTWVCNSVEYIQALNYGHSKQAPPLFIEAAVDRAVATIQARFGVKIDVDRPTGAESVAAAYSPFGDDA